LRPSIVSDHCSRWRSFTEGNPVYSHFSLRATAFEDVFLAEISSFSD
jgi:hypothetical protein